MRKHTSWMLSAVVLLAMGGIATLGMQKAPGTPAAQGTADDNGLDLNGPIPGTAPAGCMRGWSKDMCDGTLRGGKTVENTCVGPNGEVCRTWTISGAQMVVPIHPSFQGCGDKRTCDETGEIDGLMIWSFGATLRTAPECRYRGCWNGKWTIVTPGNPPTTLATGVAAGTLGTGTHRSSRCSETGCEGCYDVQFFAPAAGQQQFGFFLIHTEGYLQGAVRTGPNSSCKLCATMAGNFRIDAVLGPDGIPVLSTPSKGPWAFFGTTDGMVTCACPVGSTGPTGDSGTPQN